MAARGAVTKTCAVATVVKSRLTRFTAEVVVVEKDDDDDDDDKVHTGVEIKASGFELMPRAVAIDCTRAVLMEFL